MEKIFYIYVGASMVVSIAALYCYWRTEPKHEDDDHYVVTPKGRIIHVSESRNVPRGRDS